MTPGSPAPVIVAAVANRARREITGHFLAFHAISPGDAVAFTPGKPLVQRQFERMRESGVVKEASKGLFWLDLAAYHADIEAKRAKLLPIAIGGALLFAALAVLFYRG